LVDKSSEISKEKYQKLVKTALYLSLFTIFYNIIEGLVSVNFGLADNTLALLGFGVDSFVEVISGLGILHMIIRMQKGTIEQRDEFERTALKVTAISFFLLTAGLILGSAINLFNGIQPETTFVGIIISVISIITMYVLLKFKLRVGKQLNSDAIIADANCTKTCFYLSLILLASSLSYEIFKVSYLDNAGTIGIAYFAFREGKESFEKAKSNKLSCSCEDD
jgi:divalent metal cation (Fe/Co/Zn/Cd) transporter